MPATAIKSRPVLFNTAMVAAILAGRKMQTRRVLKVQPPGPEYQICTCISTTESPKKRKEGKHHWAVVKDLNIEKDQKQYFACPYGYNGDLLYVRETHYRYGKWIKNGKTKTGKQAWKFKALIDDFLPDEVYFINSQPAAPILPNKARRAGWYKRPSIFLPKKFARIWLEIENVRVQKLHDASERDLMAEGIVPDYVDSGGQREDGAWIEVADYHHPWIYLWDSINADRGYPYDSNPWTWAITFKRIDTKNARKQSGLVA